MPKKDIKTFTNESTVAVDSTIDNTIGKQIKCI